MTRLRAFWESVRTTYWAVPSLMAVIAIGLSVVMIHVDEVLTPGFIGTLSWVYTGGPEGARAVLSTIAGSMITVAGVTFSITIVALTLASQQFGPRLLRSFLRDLGNQIVLGTFVSTFLYCLLVLRTVRGTDDAQFVPHLAVTLGVALAMLSLGVLIFFIHHVSMSIQASEIIANVAGDLDGAVVRLFPETLGHERAPLTASTTALPDDFDRNARAVSAHSSGYVQAIDGHALLTLATERDVVLQIDAELGRFVRHGTALVRVWPNATVDDAVCESASLQAASRKYSQLLIGARDLIDRVYEGGGTQILHAHVTSFRLSNLLIRANHHVLQTGIDRCEFIDIVRERAALSVRQ